MKLEHLEHNISQYEFRGYENNFDRYILYNTHSGILTVFFLAKEKPEKYNVFIKQFDVVSGHSQHINYDNWDTDGVDSVAAKGFWNKLVTDNPEDETRIT